MDIKNRPDNGDGSENRSRKKDIRRSSKYCKTPLKYIVIFTEKLQIPYGHHPENKHRTRHRLRAWEMQIFHNKFPQKFFAYPILYSCVVGESLGIKSGFVSLRKIPFNMKAMGKSRKVCRTIRGGFIGLF
jgi:hypothetical protein